MPSRVPVLVLAFFGLTLPLSAQQWGPYGNTAGYWFSDSCDVAGITVRAGYWVDGLQVHCRDRGDFPHRGGSGGGVYTFWLDPGERIVSVRGYFDGPGGDYIYALQFFTDRRASPVYGNGGPPGQQGYESFGFDVPQDAEFQGLAGTTVDYLNSIGVNYGYGRPAPAGGAPAAPGPQRYQIGIKTGTVSGAGTDGDVWIKLRGSSGESDWLRLHNFVSGNPFENGDSDLFFVDFNQGLGEVVAISLRNDGGGLGADWYVEWVWAGFPGNQGRYFYVNQWLESGTSTMWISP